MNRGRGGEIGEIIIHTVNLQVSSIHKKAVTVGLELILVEVWGETNLEKLIPKGIQSGNKEYPYLSGAKEGGQKQQIESSTYEVARVIDDICCLQRYFKCLGSVVNFNILVIFPSTGVLSI